METATAMALGDEDLRLSLQRRLDAGKAPKERNRLGQYATPSQLAQEIISAAVSYLPASEPVDFFDPGIGTGSFFSAARREVPERLRRAAGFEVDPHYGEPAQAIWGRHGLTIELADFLTAEAPEEGFSLVVANPPYSRHHHIEGDSKRRLQAEHAQALGLKVSGLSGLYVHFMLKAHSWLSDGGVGAWLIPNEFVDVGHAGVLRQYLTKHVTLHRVHRFDSEDLQFGDALVSSAVILFSKKPPEPFHRVEFTFGGPISAPRKTLSIGVSDLERRTRWSALDRQEKGSSTSVTIGDLFAVKRGLATGANDFFVLPEAEAARLALPPEFLRYVLPGSRHLRSDVIEAEAKGAPLVTPRLVLLDCNLAEQDVRTRYPALWEYLAKGIAMGVHEGYLCSRRRPWYSQERRPSAPILVSYMGRGSNGSGPVRVFLNRSEALTTNVYLNLYPLPHTRQFLDRGAVTISELWKRISEGVEGHIRTCARTYAGGMVKAEPKELASVPVDLQIAGDLADTRAFQGLLF